MLLLALCVALAGQVVPLPQAHSHNDFLRSRPLLDALDHGFCSVEADIFRVGDALLVAHGRATLRPTRTLEALYLDPLRARVRANGGRVHPGGPPFILLIDIKEQGAEVYERLREVLARYRDMLTEVRDGVVTERAVTVVISGDRPREQILADRTRHAAIDGRLEDLESTLPVHAMPLVSDNWPSHFRWRGEGPMPEEERRKLRGIVERAHSAGRRVRFWAIPHSEAVWEELLAAGVDLLNVNLLPRLRDFLLARRERAQGAGGSAGDRGE